MEPGLLAEFAAPQAWEVAQGQSRLVLGLGLQGLGKWLAHLLSQSTGSLTLHVGAWFEPGRRGVCADIWALQPEEMSVLSRHVF